ncbi:MAG: 4,5-dihydroxyphthalate decarboxylase [Candidatus Eremiobacteraeota bacterium]|nr:4,5-dihydroxyphthalate decarboxylase [Candidatus Eremiobacteraeota bacterium]
MRSVRREGLFSVLQLSAALSVNDRTRAILDGTVAPQGIGLSASAVHPSEMFWRQLRFGDFDVSEMSLSSLMISVARGDREWVGLPVFTVRLFPHTKITIRSNASIASPGDLRGKRVGVPEYQQTTAIWSRGILQHEFGVDPREIEWFMERPPERSHGGATGFEPPAGIRLSYVAPETDLGAMLLSGELDATLLHLTAGNLIDRAKADLSQHAEVRPLFPDAGAEGRRYYAKTNLYPMNHCVVVRRSVLEQHPWVALNLFQAFVTAKERATQRAASALEPHFELGLLDAAARRGLQGDPLPYGVASSRTELETLAQYVHEQGLSDRAIGVNELFAHQTLDF